MVDSFTELRDGKTGRARLQSCRQEPQTKSPQKGTRGFSPGGRRRMTRLVDSVLSLGGLLVPICAILCRRRGRNHRHDPPPRRTHREDRARHRSRCWGAEKLSQKSARCWASMRQPIRIGSTKVVWRRTLGWRNSGVCTPGN